eukprot:SAG11_NODE_1373_length_5095_cov_3.854484_5_plen_89_part_00
MVGEDPLPFEAISQRLRAVTRHVVGGIAQQAIAAVQNALLDIKGKHLNVPVAALFGGPFRTKIPGEHIAMCRPSHDKHASILSGYRIC